MSLNPRQVSALQMLALAYQQMPNSDKALGQLEAKAADPKSSPIFSLVLATVYERQQKFDKAIILYNSLLARNLFASLARNNLAYLMAEHQPTAENLARAQKLSSETLEEHPEEPSFLDTMGWVLCKQEKYAQAKTYLEKAVGRAPNQPALLYHFELFCLVGVKPFDRYGIALHGRIGLMECWSDGVLGLSGDRAFQHANTPTRQYSNTPFHKLNSGPR